MGRRVAGCLAVLVAAAACSPGDEIASPDPTAAPATTVPATTEPAATAAAPVTTAPGETTIPVSASPATTTAARAYDFAAVGPIVEAVVAGRGLNGAGLVIVDREDGVVHEQYWGEFSADRVSFVASSSKMVAAGVLLRLQDDGLLDLDAPIAEYVDWGAGNPNITAAQLVSNSSGLVGLLPDPAYGPYVCQFIPTGTMQDCAASIFTTDADDADIVRPDTEFRYGGAQWQVAGALAEAVTGTPWSQLVDEIYAQPCGLTTLGFSSFNPIGPTGFDYPVAFDGDPSVLAATDNPNVEGGMYAAPRDYAALLLMHLRGGVCDGGRVLSQEALDTMHADRIGEVYGGTTFTGGGHGMGWWVDRATGRLTDPGAYGTVPWLDLADGYGAFLVIEAGSTIGGELAGQLYDVVDAAIVASR
jgi:CubicO group peptidase (beta-lactamase class C family)